MYIFIVVVLVLGKVFLVGGYLVFDCVYIGLVFGFSVRINVIVGEIYFGFGVQVIEIVVDSLQFLDVQWWYGYYCVGEDGGILVMQL